MEVLSKHALVRMQQRGVSTPFLAAILDNADIDRPANDNCRIYRVTKQAARALGDDRLSRFAVIWSERNGQVVTVVPLHRGRASLRYRKRQG